jgi:hypothetical protein
MGKRDFGRREARKPKKGAKKPAIPELLPTPTTVEVVKKKKGKPEGEE